MPTLKKSRSATTDVPATLCLTATAQIEVEAAADGAGTSLPRFQMLAYTGGPVSGIPTPFGSSRGN